MIAILIPYKSCTEIGKLKERIELVKEHKNLTDLGYGVYIEKEGEDEKRYGAKTKAVF